MDRVVRVTGGGFRGDWVALSGDLRAIGAGVAAAETAARTGGTATGGGVQSAWTTTKPAARTATAPEETIGWARTAATTLAFAAALADVVAAAAPPSTAARRSTDWWTRARAPSGRSVSRALAASISARAVG
jgi:hypothetical protein